MKSLSGPQWIILCEAGSFRGAVRVTLLLAGTSHSAGRECGSMSLLDKRLGARPRHHLPDPVELKFIGSYDKSIFYHSIITTCSRSAFRTLRTRGLSLSQRLSLTSSIPVSTSLSRSVASPRLLKAQTLQQPPAGTRLSSLLYRR